MIGVDSGTHIGHYKMLSQLLNKKEKIKINDMFLFSLFIITILGVWFVLKLKKTTGSDHPFEKLFGKKNDR
jgi:hypothetical protein